MVNIYASSSLDGLEPEEEKLYRLITQYRAENGLPAVPLSRALTLVANRHVLDLAENIRGTLYAHAWSDAPYSASDASTWPSMWTAPQRFQTGYPGNGYENAFGGEGGYVANAEAALQFWKSSPAHNDVILSRGIWSTRPWRAMGIGIYKGYAVLWVGEETDPTGQPSGTSSTPPGGNSNTQPQTGQFFDLTAANDQLTLQPGQIAGFAQGLRALEGDDTVQGSAANESFFGNGGSDVLAGGAGNDRILGGKGEDAVFGEDGNDTVNGNNDTDYVSGDAGDDQVNGGKDDDFLDGGDGNDTLTGDFGFNFLRGGAGRDRFVLRSDVAVQQAGSDFADVILDYQPGVDTIAISPGINSQDLFLEQRSFAMNLVGLTTGQQALLNVGAFSLNEFDPDGNGLLDRTTIRIGRGGPILGHVINATPTTLQGQIILG